MFQQNLKKTIRNRFKDVKIINNKYFEDERGGFEKIFCKKKYQKYLKKEIKQINFSTSKKVGTVRGFHYKNISDDEEKIITCLKGKIFDVIVDLRKNSKTFLKSLSLELSENDRFSLLIPKGFAHGFQSLIPNSQILYCHTNIYSPEDEKGFNICDNFLNIKWPKKISVISEKDLKLPNIKDINEFRKYM